VTAPRPWLGLVFGTILVLAHPHLAAALGDTDVKAGACSIATGGNATSNTITCNFGLTPEQLREASGRRSPLRSKEAGRRDGGRNCGNG
jgi:hypothetical protein